MAPILTPKPSRKDVNSRKRRKRQTRDLEARIAELKAERDAMAPMFNNAQAWKAERDVQRDMRERAEARVAELEDLARRLLATRAVPRELRAEAQAVLDNDSSGN